MKMGGPVLLKFLAVSIRKTYRRDVVRERVHPHIHDVLGITRQLNSPVESRSRERKILQSAANKTCDLVEALFRQHEIRYALIQIEQLVSISGQPKKITLLFDPLDWRTIGTESLAPVVEPGLAFVVIRLGAD